MDDLTANKIVFGILTLIVSGIILSIGMLKLKGLDTFVKNTSGNYSTAKFIALFLAVIGIFLLISWLYKAKSVTRYSQTRRS